MKKALAIILTIVLLFAIILFTYGAFDKKKEGIVTSYYYELTLDDFDNVEYVNPEEPNLIRGSLNGIYCLINISSWQVGEGYIKLYPYSNSPVADGSLPGSNNGIIFEPVVRLSADGVSPNLIKLIFNYDISFIASGFNATADMFTRGVGEFSIYESFNNNLLTWVADFVIEFVHFLRANITFMGGKLFI